MRQCTEDRQTSDACMVDICVEEFRWKQASTSMDIANVTEDLDLFGWEWIQKIPELVKPLQKYISETACTSREGKKLKDYWHGFIPNEDTALILKDDGDFLVRSLMVENKPICISVREGEKVYNAIVNRSEAGVYEIAGFEYNSIKEMVDELQVSTDNLSFF
ncbi:SH2 domain protein [Cooperia oncophora]